VLFIFNYHPCNVNNILLVLFKTSYKIAILKEISSIFIASVLDAYDISASYNIKSFKNSYEFYFNFIPDQ